MRKTMLGGLAASAFAIAACGLGCGGNASDGDGTKSTQQQLKEGLNLLSQSADVGIEGAFVRGDHVIYFGTRRGADVDAFYKKTDPEAPPFELDARFTDANGETYIYQMGGDSFADPSWKLVRSKNFDAKRRLVDFELAWEAAKALSVVTLPGELDLHRKALVGMALSTSPEKQAAVRANAPAAKTPTVGEADNRATTAYNGSYVDYFQIRKKCIMLCGGDHSATAWWTTDSAGNWLWWGSSCNHGTCAWNMSDVTCYASFGGSYGPPNYVTELVTDTSNGSGGCTKVSSSKWYNWESTGGGHNCHDDSRLQRNNWWYLRDDDFQGMCTDGKNYWKAPNCSDRW